jgi:cytochrome P450 family 9
MRSTLSPAFTGSKMRQMFDFVSTVGQQTAKTMQEDIRAGKDSAVEFKALAMRFTVDVIASCAFGIEVNSFKHPENDFYNVAHKVANLNNNTAQILKFFGFQICPKLMKLLKIDLLDRSISEFFREATLETMKVREQKGIVRQDMINLLMQSQKGQLVHSNEEKSTDGFAAVEESEVGRTKVNVKWNDNELIGQCLIFFLAGFDTVRAQKSPPIGLI